MNVQQYLRACRELGQLCSHRAPCFGQGRIRFDRSRDVLGMEMPV